MGRDAQANYIHLTKSHYALYISHWVHDKLPNEDIEAPGFHLDEDEDDESSAMQQTAFGSLKSHRKGKQHLWKDMDLQKFLNEDLESVNKLEDNTILKRIDNLHEFDSPDVACNPSPNTSSNINQEHTQQATLPSFEITTPNVTRNRVSQRNTQNYQTPIGRIMR